MNISIQHLHLQTRCNMKTKSSSWDLGAASRFVAMSLWSRSWLMSSWCLKFEFMVLESGSLAQSWGLVKSVIFTKGDKKILESVTGITKFVRYYKVRQKIIKLLQSIGSITNKVQQVLQSLAKSYCKVWQALQSVKKHYYRVWQIL